MRKPITARTNDQNDASVCASCRLVRQGRIFGLIERLEIRQTGGIFMFVNERFGKQKRRCRKLRRRSNEEGIYDVMNVFEAGCFSTNGE